MHCPACGKANPPEHLSCFACGRSLMQVALPVGVICARCASPLARTDRFCARCGAPAGAPEALPFEALPVGAPRKRSVEQGEPRRPPVAPRPTPGRQSPLLALLLAVVLPGAGQAYNGQPVKGFFLFFTSILVIPYLFSLADAYGTAATLKAAGLSSGCSGFFWVFLQLWLACNTVVLAVLVLSALGILT